MQVRTETVEQHRTRVIIDFDHAPVRTAGLVVFSALWIYTAFLTLPFTYWMPVNSLDGSHAFGSNYFPHEGFRYGADLIFTFGPLGFLVYPENVGNHILIANLVRAMVWALLLWHLILFYRLGPGARHKSILLMIAIASSRLFLLESFDYYALAVLLVIILYLIEQPNARLAFAAAIFITGILSLTKFTSHIMALACVAILPAYRNTRTARMLGLAAIAALPIAFLLHNPSVGALFNYVYGGFELASGYNAAMSLPASSADLFYAAVLGFLFAAGVTYAVVRRELGLRVAAILLLLYWLNFKHGFVRGTDHPTIAFCFEIILAAVLLSLLRPRSRLVTAYVVGFPIFVVTALAGTNDHWLVWNKGFWFTVNGWQKTTQLLNWKTTTQRIDQEIKNTDEFQQLPEAFRTRLEGRTATVFPWEVVYARSGHFRVEPLYTMQAYSAYTEYLDRKTAERIRSGGERAEYVLLDWQSIDDRHPLLDVPATWMALVDNYQLESVTSGKLLLKRRPAPLHHEQRRFEELPLPIGKWVDLPDAKTELWASIRIPSSFVGAARTAAFKANPIYLTVRSRERTSRFRIVPEVLSSAFPLNSFPADFDAFVDALENRPVIAPITSVRLDTESPGHYETPSLQLLQESESRITFGGVSEKSFQTEFHLSSASEIANISAGSIDLINDSRNPSSIPDEQHPVAISTAGGLILAGWLADKPEGRSFDEVYATANGRLFRAARQQRPDVGAFFKNPALDQSGFHLQIPGEDLRKGIQRLDLIGVFKDAPAPYRFSKPVYVQVP